MLLQLDNTKKSDIQKLFEFAKENDLQLKLVDADKTQLYLPGKPLSSKELKQLIDHSRRSGTITMKKGHRQIRKKIQENKLYK